MYSIFLELLEKTGKSVADVSRATGITQSTLSNWKHRGNRLSPKNAMLIAEFFGVSLDYLMGNAKQDISHDSKAQSLFESQLKLDGWKIDHEVPSKGKPCEECMDKRMSSWAESGEEDPGQMCDVCTLHDTRHILTKGDQRIVLTDEQFNEMIRRNQFDAASRPFGHSDQESACARYRVPVVRRVAAGLPFDSIHEIIDWEELPAHVAKTGNYFGLKIKGDSMEPEISDGDVIIVREQEDAEDGQIVVALVNADDGVCKKLKKYDGDGIALISLNPAYQPMYFNRSECDEIPVVIRGVVKELRRKF